MARQISSKNTYFDRLVKLIPTEIIGAFVAAESIVGEPKDTRSKVILTVAFFALLFIIPFYLRLAHHVVRISHIFCSMVSFGVWAYSLGGLKPILPYDGKIGGVGLLLWTMMIPIIMVRRTAICKGDIVQIISKPSSFNRPDIGLMWNEDMTPHCGEQAQVTSINKKEMTARIDRDQGTNIWAFEWLTPKQ